MVEKQLNNFIDLLLRCSGYGCHIFEQEIASVSNKFKDHRLNYVKKYRM